MSDKRHILKDKAIGRVADAFTLIEMLAVIGIIAVIAAFSVPVLKNFGKNDVAVSASRQLLDDVGRARQLAMSQRTTVYMVFLPTNFWNLPNGTLNNNWMNSLAPSALTEVSNLMDKQLTGYTYMANGALGDQPGQHQWHYLTPWQSLPDGVYIPMYKFYNPAGSGISYNFTDPDPTVVTDWFNIFAFNVTNTFPFPTATNNASPSVALPFLPYIAFNYLGQLSDYSGNLLTSLNMDQDFVGGGIDIPLVQGSVLPDLDAATRALKVGPPQINEMPPGNGTNISFTVIHIDPLTGRSTLEYHKMQ